jgi:hypothetical protein
MPHAGTDDPRVTEFDSPISVRRGSLLLSARDAVVQADQP